MVSLKKWKASRPKAKSWDKIQARDRGETLAHRDVYDDQQLDRGVRQQRVSGIPGIVFATIIGVIVFILAWAVYSGIALGIATASQSLSNMGNTGGGSQEYYTETTITDDNGNPKTCFYPLDDNGEPVTKKCYGSAEEVPRPKWASEDQAEENPTHAARPTLGSELTKISFFKLFVTGGIGAAVGLVIGSYFSRQTAKRNIEADTSAINQHTSDQHIALPEEIQRAYDWFPDAGAHSSVEVSSMISHMMLKNKGLKKVEVTQRAGKNNPEYDEGEALLDDDGEVLTTTEPIIDEKFGVDLFEASGVSAQSGLQKFYDTTKVPYNPGNEDRDKLHGPSKKNKRGQEVGGYHTVADLINDDWEFPAEEVQRPAGAYIVDTAPVNTMVLAITRAGKGQTYIEPIIDMWSREKNPSNMVINDPKGELLVKNYVPLVKRGFQPVQFNLINATKTDIYNPLLLAANAAREGDSVKAESYVVNIADVFFPTDAGDDPMWQNAANNAFKRAVFGLIDYYMEEERELRVHARTSGMDPEILAQRLDEMWGRVTLYNCYQLFVQLSSKKLPSPIKEFEQRVSAGEFDEDPDDERKDLEQKQAHQKAEIWEGKPEMDMLSLFFNATEKLPANEQRKRTINANNALRSMAGAEKMLASVYGIAITAMSFFTDETISMLTSGRPSQNVDLAGVSFPRRLGVRFAQNYMKRDNLVGLQASWTAYGDSMFTQPLGKDFNHEDTVTSAGWARYFFKGIFPKRDAYVKLELKNAQTGLLVRTFFFQFTKGYQLSFNGRHYVTEPVTGKKIIKDGVLRELKPKHDDAGEIISFAPSDTTYKQPKIDLVGAPEMIEIETQAIIQHSIGYVEMPKAVFLVTPPHLMAYARLILILVKQLVDLNFDQSYMTKKNQKPLYRTRFMLDELGNLQSEGKGIAGFQTMLSIGLGQSQQFTLILQTLQQLIDVYGESVDKIIQGNTSNIIFLKSTDNSMIETLEKMSGVTHRTYADSRQITKNLDKLVGGKIEGNVSITESTVEEPLIKYNDMAFISPRNSIVFRAGDPPVWNRNETILPMSWRLLKNTITHPGHEYTLQTIPTMSTAKEFDVRMNQPDFTAMLKKRMQQAYEVDSAVEQYKDATGLTDLDIERLDPELYSDEIMEIVTHQIAENNGVDTSVVSTVDPSEIDHSGTYDDDAVIDDVAVKEEALKYQRQKAQREKKIFAEGTISPAMLVSDSGAARVRSLDHVFAEAYKSCRYECENDTTHFSVNSDGSLCSTNGEVYIRQLSVSEVQSSISQAAQDPQARVYAEDEVSEEDVEFLSVEITAAFYKFLASQDSWVGIADGEFDRMVAREMTITDK